MKRLQVWYIAVDQNPKYDYWKICLEDESRRRSWSLKWSGRGGQAVWSSGVLRRRRRRLRILLAEEGFEPADREHILLATYFKEKQPRPQTDHFVRAIAGLV